MSKVGHGDASSSSSAAGLLSILENTLIKDLSAKQPQLYFVKTHSLISEALEIMSTHNILSVPVFDEAKNKFVGMLDVQDAVSLFLSLLRNNHNPSVEFAKATVDHVFNLSGIDVFMPTPKNRSLYHLIEVFTRGVYRIPVTEDEDTNDTSGIFEGIGGGSASKIVSLVTQSSVVRFLADRLDKFTPAQANMSFNDAHLAHKKVITVHQTQSTIEALALLEKTKVSALAVIDENGTLVDTFSAANLRGITCSTMYLLNISVVDFLAERKSAAEREQLYTCKFDSTLREVLTSLASSGVHRLWVLDEKRKPVGVIATSDVMKALLVAARKE